MTTPMLVSFFAESVIGTSALSSSRDLHRRAIEKNPKLGVEDAQEDMDAINEHQGLDAVSLFVSTSGMIEHVSISVSWFFSFLHYLWVVYWVMAALGIISYGFFFYDLYQLKQAGETVFPDFPYLIYVASYFKSDYRAWLASSGLCVIFLFSVGPIWARRIDNYRAKRARGDLDYVEDPFEGQYNIHANDCVDKIDYPPGHSPTPRSQSIRRFFSFLFFVFLLILSGIANYEAQAKLLATGDQSLAMVLSVLLALVNFLFEVVCTSLTEFEHHLYYSDFRKLECVKLFFFKIMSIVVMFYVISTVPVTCAMPSMAHTFLYLLAINYLVSLAHFFQAVITWKCCKKRAERAKASNDDARPEFVLSVEYVEQLARFFIVSLGFFVCPILPLLAVFGNFIEYWFIKYKMLRITRKPRRNASSYKAVLLSSFFLMALLSLLSYPNGAAWVLQGYPKASQNCPVFT